MALIAEYHMYLECASGAVDADWKLEEKEIMSFRQFKLRQSEQMCKYRPRQRKYPGDGKVRDSTEENRNRKRKTPSSSGTEVVKADILDARDSGRLCSHDFMVFGKHLDSVARKKKGADPSKCAACGEGTYYKCNLCNVPLCYPGSRGCTSWNCVMDYHNDECFGLLRRDAAVAKNWKKPSARKRTLHADHIHAIMK